jgi:ABC-2 type transport system permease protein
MALPLVKGLLAQHVMGVVSRAAFGGDGNTKALADARAEVAGSTSIAGAERRDLLALFESVERLQATQRAAPKAGGDTGPSFSMPFETRQEEVTSGIDRRYNGYSHAFAGMGVQFVLFMGIELGVGLLLMRRMGLWKRLRAAPVSRTLLLGSRIVSGTVIAAMLLAGIYAAALLVFGVRIEGSVLGFVLVAFSFALLTSSFGLLIAALGNTPEATRGLAILVTLMLVMLGGAWVPTFVFPEWLQGLTQFVPTRWAIDGLEAMTWRGLELSAVLVPVAAMLACSAAFAAIAMRRFSWDE